MLDVQFDIQKLGLGDSFIHKLHPAVKLIITIALIAICTISNSALYSLLLTILCFVLMILADVKIKSILKVYLVMLYFIIFTILIYMLITGPSLVRAIEIWAGLTAVGMPSIFLMFTTPLLKTLYGLEYILAPLAKIKIPVNAIVLICTIALSFIPIVISELQRILYSMAVRGMDIRYVSFKQKIKVIGYTLIPLLIATLNRSETLAAAIAVKNYNAFNPRTNVFYQAWKKSDTIFLVSQCALIYGLFVICV